MNKLKIFSGLLLSLVGLSIGCSLHGANKLQFGSSLADDTDFIASIALSNPLELDREDEPVEISLYDLGVAWPEFELSQFAVKVGDKVIPSQLIDSDGDGKKDSLMMLLGFSPGEQKRLDIYHAKRLGRNDFPKRTQAEIAVKVDGNWGGHKSGNAKFKAYEGGRFVNVNSVTTPDFYTDHSEWIRYEGPGLESDKVGYRIYLDWRNGFDIFGKRIEQPVLQNVGLDGYESYHHLQDWGMDILKVGDSLGAGGFGFWQGNNLVQVADVKQRTATVLDNGDVHSSIKIHYQQWQVNGKKIDVTAQLAIAAGSRLVQNTIQLNESLPNLSVGFVDHEGAEFIVGPQNTNGNSYSYIASFGKQSLAGDHLGVAVFFRSADSQSLQTDGKSRFAVLGAKSRKVHYYFGAYWQGELNSGVGNIEDFKSELDRQAEKLSHPLRMKIKTKRTLHAIERPLSADAALSWSRALADSELKRKTLFYHAEGWDVNRARSPKFEYDIVGLLPFAYDELGRTTGEQQYQQIKYLLTGSFVTQDGSLKAYDLDNYNIDAVAPGRVLLRLYQETGLVKYKKALQVLRKQLAHQPKTHNGAFWHKKRYPGQLWLDGVYMGMPFLAEYSVEFSTPHAIDEVMQEFKITRSLLRDQETGLYYHGWDEDRKQEWADNKTGLSSHFWARGMGWMAMALVDVLDYIPAERIDDRTYLTDMVVETALALKRYRDKDATWWQIMDKPNQLGNYRESSASAMFTYFFAKAINNGYLTDADFGGNTEQFALQNYQGLLSNFILVHANGEISMTNQCLVAGLGFGRDGSYEYYLSEPVVKNDPKGTGPFILAGVEISKMLKRNKND